MPHHPQGDKKILQLETPLDHNPPIIIMMRHASLFGKYNFGWISSFDIKMHQLDTMHLFLSHFFILTFSLQILSNLKLFLYKIEMLFY